jgi:enoyl-CoA hydratase/carnithine racemase
MMDAPATEKQPAATIGLANVLYEKKDAIAYVTVNRPKVLNALNTPTWADIRTAFEDARDDSAVRGVILTGACTTRAGAILRKIASNAPMAVKFALTAVNKGLETSQDEGLLLEASYFGLCAGTEDKKEGTSAFLEKRAPQFHGR